MAIFKGTIVVENERCKGCELCTVACRLKLIRMSEAVNRKGYHYAQQIDSDACNGCAACALGCPDACITVYRTKSES